MLGKITTKKSTVTWGGARKGPHKVTKPSTVFWPGFPIERLLTTGFPGGATIKNLSADAGDIRDALGHLLHMTIFNLYIFLVIMF